LGALLEKLGVLSLAGTLELGLYPYFILAAALGWLCGNVYLHRRRRLPREVWRWILPIYLLGPPGVLFLLHATSSAEWQELTPFFPFLASLVFLVFLLVPLTLGGSWSLPPEEREQRERR
jgi:hypothetical protein